MPVIIVAPIRWTRSPLQIFLLAITFISGIVIIINKSESKVIQSMHEPWATIWGCCLVVGALIALAGAFWKNKITGMLIERSGTVLLGGASFLWPIAVIKYAGLSALYPATITLVFSGACIWQVAYINHHMNLILKAIDDAGKRDE